MFSYRIKCRSVGDVYSGTFKKLVESMVHSVLLYDVEAWGFLKRMDSLEQLQLKGLRTYFGVGRNHPRVSLLAEMSCLIPFNVGCSVEMCGFLV